MRYHNVAVGLILCAVAALSGCATVSQAPYEDVWDRYTVMLWPFQVPEPGPKYKAAMDSVGLQGTQLDGAGGGISKQRLAFVMEEDLPYYVGHTASKGYLHLTSPEKGRVMRQLHPVPRPHCLSNPATMDAMKKAIHSNVTAAKAGRCVGYAYDDEISAVSFTSPCDTCTSQWCLPRFRAFLEKMYGSIDALNAQWGTVYKGFDQVSVVGTEKTRIANDPQRLPKWNLSGWVDSREYIDQLFADTLEELTEYTNTLDPARPAGYVGGGGPTAFGGYDYEKIAKSIQWIEAYDIGGANEILRSFMPKAPAVQTWFDNGSPQKNKWYNWYYWAHGNRGQIIWPSTGSDNPWFDQEGKPRPDIAALRDMLVEIQGDKIGKLLMGADFVHDGIALYYGQPSVRVSWFIDIIPHKETWPNRLSSLNNGNDSSHWNRYGWMKLLEDCGLQYNYVSPGQIASDELIKKGYKVLVLGRALALSDAEAEAIKKFVAQGGWVVADHLCGVFDEHGKVRSQGALDELFGVTHDLSKGLLNGKVLYEIDAELYSDQPIEKKVSTAYDGAPRWNGLVVYERGLQAAGGKAKAEVDGLPALVRNGRAVYLNLSPVYHCVDRYQPETAAWPGVILSLMADAGITPRARVINVATGKAEPIAECLYWRLRDGRTALCVIKNRFRSASISGAGTSLGDVADTPMKVRVDLSQPVTDLRNERTGRAFGNVAAFEEYWVTSEALVLTYK